jgi:acetylxylan esterase
VPDRVAAKPPIVVVVHYCGGSAQAMYTGTEFASLANQYGFIVVYPEVTRSSKCFDVSQPGALRHDGNSDPAGIVSMVNYVVAHNNGDASRVYATGTSSGAMMTNVLLGDYPDVFKAGAAFAGVPFACFATTNGSEWNSDCAQGNRIMTAQQWGDLVRNAYPGYSGPRPRMQLWHGTADDTLRYPNFGEEIKQWTNVLGVSQTPSFTDSPQATWTRTRYGGTGDQAPVEGISIQNGTHGGIYQSGDGARVIRFFGLDGSAPPTSAPPTSAPPTTAPPTSPPPTSAPPTSPPPTSAPPTGACSASISLNQWTGGFVATVRVTAGSAAINTWTATMTLPTGSSVANTWNATASGTTGTVRFTNASYNGHVNAGQYTEFGFQGTGSGTGMTPTCTAN